MNGNAQYAFEIVPTSFPGAEVSGYSIRSTSSKIAKESCSFWKECVPKLAVAAGGTLPEMTYGVCSTINAASGIIMYTAGVLLMPGKQDDPDLQVIEIPAGNYAMINVPKPSEVFNAYIAFNRWSRENGCELIYDMPYFEQYPKGPGEDAQLFMYMPITKASSKALDFSF